ncbi:ImmA/IrrE family metallo-endopeptidase [Patescibacteria group bacterium]|nr:ImmA/IrrE family metallo-endopeptidase [Patescibacteria group bacterium]
MSSLAQQKANEVIKLFISNDPYTIAAGENIEVFEQPMSGRLKELYFGDYIVLNQTMTHNNKRHYLAHALGHHYMHTGNYLFFTQMRYLQNTKEEVQAEEFAAHLLIPNNKLRQTTNLNIAELADHFQVSPHFVKYRLELQSKLTSQ